MTVIQLFNRQSESERRFEVLNRENMDANIFTIFYYALFYPLMEMIAAISMAVIIWFGGGRPASRQTAQAAAFARTTSAS